MDALVKTNFEHTDGYGLDEHCEHAARMVQDLIDNHDCHVHMMVGGTPCNVTTIAASLKPYESVVSVRGGHAYFHETGAVEGTGHRHCHHGRCQWETDTGNDRSGVGRI